jgi:hypothetical protein
MAGRVSNISKSDWRVYLRRSAGGLILATGLVLLAFVAFHLIQDASLWTVGRRTAGRIDRAWIERDAATGADAPTFRWFIRYQFRTSDGRVFTGVSRLSAKEWAALDHAGPVDVVDREDGAQLTGDAGGIENGGAVDVVYLPAYPTHNRLDDSQFVPLLACAYVPLILLGGAGMLAGRSLFRSA